MARFLSCCIGQLGEGEASGWLVFHHNSNTVTFTHRTHRFSEVVSQYQRYIGSSSQKFAEESLALSSLSHWWRIVETPGVAFSLPTAQLKTERVITAVLHTYKINTRPTGTPNIPPLIGRGFEQPRSISAKKKNVRNLLRK